MSIQSETIEAYSVGDEEQILELMWTVFGIKKSRELWAWQFTGNEQGNAWITLAKTGEVLTGHYATIRFDLNLKGKRVFAGESCDLMVRSDQQGKGLFSRLARENFESARRDGMKAVIGFPNRNSYPNFVRNLGWSRIATLKCYSFRTGLQKFIGIPADSVIGYMRRVVSSAGVKILKKISKKRINIVSTENIPENLDNFLRECRDYEVVSLWKDVPYLKWRYAEHPLNHYAFHTMTVDGRVTAFAVTRDCGDVTALCEIFHCMKDVTETSLFLRCLVHRTIVERKSKIVFYGFDNGFFDAAFIAAGFKVVPTSHFMLCGEVFEDGQLASEFRQPQNWTVSYGDMDIV